MWTLKEITKTTVRLIQNHWLLMLIVVLLTIVNGVYTIVTDAGAGARGGLSLARSKGDSLHIGLILIAMGVGMIGFKWYICHLERLDLGEFKKR